MSIKVLLQITMRTSASSQRTKKYKKTKNGLEQYLNIHQHLITITTALSLHFALSQAWKNCSLERTICL